MVFGSDFSKLLVLYMYILYVLTGRIISTETKNNCVENNSKLLGRIQPNQKYYEDQHLLNVTNSPYLEYLDENGCYQARSDNCSEEVDEKVLVVMVS